MDELLLQAFYLILEIFDRLDEEFISVIEYYQHLLASDFVEAVPVVGVAEFGDFVELVPEHVLVSDVVEIYEEVDLVYSSLDEVGSCLYGEGSLANTWMAVQEEKIQVLLLDFLHEFVELLLAAHDRRVLHFFVIFSKFRSGVIDDLRPEVHIFLQLIQWLGVILINWQHLKLVALTMGDLWFF